jgi:hypothetical protein
MFILDTNVLSELRRPDKADRRVQAWAATQPLNSFYLSAITIMELELGILSVTRKDAGQGAVLRQWMEQQVLPRFEGRILPVDTAVARRCAALRIPDPRSERDALIAATALVHGMTVATRNVADFAPTGVPVFNPWAES